jgi:hypothetical protein
MSPVVRASLVVGALSVVFVGALVVFWPAPVERTARAPAAQRADAPTDAPSFGEDDAPVGAAATEPEAGVDEDVLLDRALGLPDAEPDDGSTRDERRRDKLDLPPFDTGPPADGDRCGALATDRKRLSTAESMLEKIPEKNARSIGAQRLREVTARLERSVERRSKAIARDGETCPER